MSVCSHVLKLLYHFCFGESKLLVDLCAGWCWTDVGSMCTERYKITLLVLALKMDSSAACKVKMAPGEAQPENHTLSQKTKALNYLPRFLPLQGV